MTTPQELKSKFWNSLKSDRTMMLGVSIEGNGYCRPMTAQFENDQSPIWFFTSTDNAIVQAIGSGKAAAIANFSAKNHDLFATVHGNLTVDKDQAVIDRLWNAFVAAWFEGGKNDPKLTLLRLDAASAEIWGDASSIVAGIKMLLGADPKEDYKDKRATVNM